jgi:phage shock protein A
MVSSTGNIGENIVSNPQVLLMQVYAQLNEAITGRQQAIACYQEHIIRHEAQVFALNNQIDTLKDELRMARADAETSRLSGTRCV